MCIKAGLFLALIIATVCADVNTGTQSLSSDRVAQIKKGVTTRAEVEQLLGPPSSVSMMGDGRRMMFYMGMQQHINQAGRMAFAVPLGGILIPANDSASRRMEQLQVVLSKADIVEDYEFSDSTTNTQGSTMFGTAHQSETTTANH